MSRKALWFLLLAGCSAWEPRYDTVAPPSNYARAEDAMHRGDVQIAIPLLESYIRETADPTYRPRAYFQLARAYYSQAQYRKTLATIDEMETEFPKEKWPQTAALRGDAEYALGNRTTGFLAWESAWQRGGTFDQAALRERMGRAVKELTPDEIRELRQMVTVKEIQEMLKEPAVAGIDESERPLVKDLPPSPPTAQTAPRGAAPHLVEEPAVATAPTAPITDEVYVDQNSESASSAPAFPSNAPRLGALLSLTGADRNNGQQALKGLRQSGVGTTSPLELRDTGSDPTLAAQLFNSMANDPRVLAVIAPLRGEEAAAVAPLADRLSVPLLLPSDYNGPAGRFALKATTGPSEQISALVSYVFGTLRLKRFGVLYPSDQLGQSRMEKFQNEALALGATLVGIKGYTPGKTDFVSETAAVLRWETEGGLEALYIADNARATTALGSALHSRAPRLVLLAALDGVERDLVVKAAPDLEGAIFASNDVGIPARAGGAALGTETYAFEAGVIGRRALEAGATSREQILGQLRSMGKFGGVDQLFRIRQGKLESVGAAPTQS
jgi:hypothetical protein